MPVERRCPMCSKPTKRPIMNWIDDDGKGKRWVARGCMFCYLGWKKKKLKENDANDDPDDIL
ncbi:MAG: hypothetical protein EHM34_00325 [Nitrosopumilales archaeon]|nr:MAG: hypothetical protein EHM34_00325 [Nitrosopumilales archaeon]